MQGDGRKIRVDVGVVVFERGEDQLVRMIVEKFRAAIEEGGLVFVALDDELFPAAETVAAVAEIWGDAADQKIGLAPGDVKNPREHGGGGGFAVRSGNHDRGVARDEILLEELRHRAVGQFFVENIFDFWIAARDYVAYDAQVRRRLQIFGAKSFVPADAQEHREAWRLGDKRSRPSL